MTSKFKLNAISTPSKKESHLLTMSPNSTNAESDDDSGIVAIANGQRIGSTSSNSDEDNIYRENVCQSTNQSISGAKHRVRFDDELHLSEQNMRKSCRKLFATLFHQNKDNNHEELTVNSNLNNISTDKPSLLPSCHCHYFTQTLPHKKSLHSFGSMNSRTNSELNLNVDVAQHFKSNDESHEKCGGLLLQTVPQLNGMESHQCPYAKAKQLNSLQAKRLNPIKSYSVWSINEKSECNHISVDCNAALSRIKSMSDRLESSSMVNAFARPVLIQTSDINTEKDSIYETIFPINNKNDGNTRMYSSKVQIKKWLNSDKIESNRNERQKEESNESNNNIIRTSLSLPHSQKSTFKSRKSILKVLPNTNTNTIPEKIINSSLDSCKRALISADQIYPQRDDEELTDFEEEEKRVEYASVNKERSDRFCNSYSAGDEVTHRTIENIPILKSAISETNLHESSGNRKSFLQRFKSAITRAFTIDKINKQSIDNSPVKDNHNESHFSQSQTDLRININPNGTNDSFTENMINKCTVNRSPSESFVKNLRTRMSIRKNLKVDMKGNSPERKIASNNKMKSLEKRILFGQQPAVSDSQLYDNNQVWGELIKLNSDSSQVIQIHRKKGKAFGFFVARGTVNNIKGVFVSRMKDECVQKSLVGVLEIGDEILAIDGESVKEGNIMQVNQLIANKETIRLTIVPYMNNKYL